VRFCAGTVGGETFKLRLEADSLRQRRTRKLHLFMCVWTSCGAQADRNAAAHVSLTFEKFADDVWQPVLCADVVDGKNIRMVQRGGCAGLLLEARRRPVRFTKSAERTRITVEDRWRQPDGTRF
jgi:hypothetical protein